MNQKEIVKMVMASSFSEISIYVQEVVEKFKKHHYTNKDDNNIKNVASRFKWWHNLNQDAKNTIIEAVKKKL